MLLSPLARDSQDTILVMGIEDWAVWFVNVEATLHPWKLILSDNVLRI